MQRRVEDILKIYIEIIIRRRRLEEIKFITRNWNKSEKIEYFFYFINYNNYDGAKL